MLTAVAGVVMGLVVFVAAGIQGLGEHDHGDE